MNPSINYNINYSVDDQNRAQVQSLQEQLKAITAANQIEQTKKVKNTANLFNKINKKRRWSIAAPALFGGSIMAILGALAAKKNNDDIMKYALRGATYGAGFGGLIGLGGDLLGDVVGSNSPLDKTDLSETLGDDSALDYLIPGRMGFTNSQLNKFLNPEQQG